MMKIKNRILANSVATPAIPVNPKIAAMIAMTRNVMAQLSMIFFSVKTVELHQMRKIFNPILNLKLKDNVRVGQKLRLSAPKGRLLF